MLTKSSLSLSKDKKKITIELSFDTQVATNLSESIFGAIMQFLFPVIQTYTYPITWYEDKNIPSPNVTPWQITWSADGDYQK